MSWHELVVAVLTVVGAITVPALWVLVCVVRGADITTRLHALAMLTIALVLGTVQGLRSGAIDPFVALQTAVLLGAGWTLFTVAVAQVATEPCADLDGDAQVAKR